jgi:predicted O-methyltransferase YrrM
MLKPLYRFLHPRFQTLFLEYKVHFAPRYGHGKPPHAGLYDIINAHRDTYRELLQQALTHRAAFQQITAGETDPAKPRWNNGFLPGLDIIGIYTLLAALKPARYVEVGSGNSTKVAYKAKKELGLNTEIVSIDPQPRAEIDALADRIIRAPFETVDYDFVLELQENDVLFIDNSHRILPNSDAMVFFMEILPRLKPGVVVQIHDIYLPYDYPQFMCDRFYSEQYGLAAFVLANPARYKPLLPCYFISEDPELSALLQPIWEHPNLNGVERHGGSFWLRIN